MPGAPKRVLTFLYWYTAHKILTSAIKCGRAEGQLFPRKSIYVVSLLGPEAESGIYDCLVLILGQAWQRAPSLNVPRGPRLICDATA